MQSVLDFIQAYWPYMSFGFLVLVEVLLWIFKKTKIIDPSIYQILVNLVSEAEKRFGAGNGEQKMLWVLDSFSKMKGELPYTERYVRSVVEKILSTPQKKGD